MRMTLCGGLLGNLVNVFDTNFSSTHLRICLKNASPLLNVTHSAKNYAYQADHDANNSGKDILLEKSHVIGLKCTNLTKHVGRIKIMAVNEYKLVKRVFYFYS